MANCDGLIAGDILNDCLNSSIAGLEANVTLFNIEDIKKSSTTFDALNPLKVTNFELNTGKTGYLLESVKQVHLLKYERVKKELGNDKFKHTFSFRILNPTVENRNKLFEMNGGYFAVMVEAKWKGANNAEPFLLGGYDSGMQIQVETYASNENDGTIAVELSSVDGYEEPKPLMTFLDTDYQTSKTLFNNKFSAD